MGFAWLSSRTGCRRCLWQLARLPVSPRYSMPSSVLSKRAASSQHRRYMAWCRLSLGSRLLEPLFVSGNPWDSQAALASGFAVVRVNRYGDPDEYGLRRHLVAELHDLTGLPELLVPPAA